MRNFLTKALNKAAVSFVALLTLLVGGGLGTTSMVLASATSSFTQVINAGTLSVDIVNTSSSYATVASPSFALGAKTFSFACQSSTGTFGTATQAIYVSDPDALGANTGWAVSLAASAPTATWTGTNGHFDFNDPAGTGCTDTAAGEADSYGGQMTVDPSVGTLTIGQYTAGVTTGISKGSSAAFSEVAPIVNSITLVSGSGATSRIGDWVLTGVGLTQTIPAAQPAGSDYAISLTMSIVAS